MIQYRIEKEKKTTTQTIIRIAFPAMVEQFLQMLVGMVDSYLVANLGLVAISGVSVAGNIITIYHALFIALGAAITSLVAKSSGQRDKAKSNYYVTETIKVTILLSLVLGLPSLLWGQKMIFWLGTENIVAQTGGLYLSLVGGMIVLLGLMTTLGSLVRIQKNPRLPMYVSLLTNVLNVLFSSIALTFFHLGIAGVALGTILARLIGVFFLWRALDFPLPLRTWSVDRDLLRLALLAAGERLMMRAGDIVVIALVARFGTEAVAGNAIGETLTQFNYMPSFGVATATVMLVAQAFGEKDWQRIQELGKKSYLLSVCLMFPLACFIFLFGNILTQMYTTDVAAMNASLLVIFFSLLGVPLTAGTVIYTAVWQGLGNSQIPFYATSIGMWFIRIVAGYLLGVVFQFGLAGVWAATLLDNAFRWLFLGFLYRRKMVQ